MCAGDKGLLNVTADKVEVLCIEAGGLPFKTVDGVDVTKEGVVYFTELTYKYSPKDILLGYMNTSLMVDCLNMIQVQ